MGLAFIKDSFCGIKCDLCPIYRANQNGTVDELAKERDMKPEDLICYGCKSQKCTAWCTDCSIKRCAVEKRYEFCYQECNKYPCGDIFSHTNVPVFQEDSYCGLFCGACEIYIANKFHHLKELAEQRSLPEKDLVCYGCKSKLNSVFCGDCEIKKCNIRKKIDFCFECGEYPCNKINAFSTGEHPHKRVVTSNQEYIRKYGKDAWLAEQRKAWRCRECGTVFGFYQKECRKCGHIVNTAE